MTMREKIARTIYEKRNGNGCTPWRMQSGAHKVPYLSDAEAALDALIEPTEGMRSAAHSLADIHGYKLLIRSARGGK